MQICTRCILDSTIEGITFNSEGVCRFCQDFDQLSKKEKPVAERELSLERIIDQIKNDGKGKDYDCLIGLSGGVDSSYVAFLTKKYGLRPLAIHLDNGWNAELAVSNIESICKKLDIDLYTHVINWQEFKDLQISFLKASVSNAEAPTDHAIFAILYKMALKHGIKYILDGVNTSTEFTRKDMMQAGYIYADLTQIKGIHKKYGKVPLKTFPSMSIVNKQLIRKLRGIKQVSILNYVEFNKKNAMQILIDELGWRPYDGKHHESVFTKWHQLVYLPKKFGFDKRRIHVSDLILSGQMTREEALNEVERKPLSDFELQQLEEYVQKKLGLTSEEYKEIMTAKPKKFSDYPNSKWMLDLYNRMIKQ